jgi:hypothetical protein
MVSTYKIVARKFESKDHFADLDANDCMIIKCVSQKVRVILLLLNTHRIDARFSYYYNISDSIKHRQFFLSSTTIKLTNNSSRVVQLRL